MGKQLVHNFLGEAPNWYKLTILGFIVANPFLLAIFGPFFTGWVIIAEFIFTLAMALKCYPLAPAGLIALESVVMGLTTPATVYHETHANFPVIMLLMFMVAGIHFMKDGLLFVFTKLLINVRSKVMLSLLFCFVSAFLSAFLDALTVTAVIIAVAYGFYSVYHSYASDDESEDYAVDSDELVLDAHKADLEQFKGFLRNLMMHAAVGTALGGVTTMVGEPQNLIIAEKMKWHFADFVVHTYKVTFPVLIAGLATCWALEKTKLFGYGYQIPGNVYDVLKKNVEKQAEELDASGKMKLIVQGVVGILLVLSLALHLAEVGVIGLFLIVLLAAFNGVISEHEIGHAFTESLPFTALLVVFFAVVAVIHDQHLFKPVTDYVLAMSGHAQLGAYFVANGVLSAVSDNVFVATVYMNETISSFKDIVPLLGTHEGLTVAQADRIEHLSKLAASINTGTNIPSVATPNGQAAFLFLLTSALAPLIRLSYIEMVKLAMPYTIVMSITGFVATIFLL
jgi:NhaB family Na+:H+ antiporter